LHPEDAVNRSRETTTSPRARPILSLMKDQVDKLAQAGVHAVAANSSLTAPDPADALRSVKRNERNFVFTTPERLADPEFVDLLNGHRVDLPALQLLREGGVVRQNRRRELQPCNGGVDDATARTWADEYRGRDERDRAAPGQFIRSPATISSSSSSSSSSLSLSSSSPSSTIERHSSAQSWHAATHSSMSPSSSQASAHSSHTWAHRSHIVAYQSDSIDISSLAVRQTLAQVSSMEMCSGCA
jgi:hypothetical protein